MLATLSRRTTAVVVIAGVALLLAIDYLYVTVIRTQGGPPSDTPFVVPFIAGYVLVMAILLGASAVVPPVFRPGLRAASATGLLALGVLSLFSIGLLILVGAGLAIAAMLMGFRARPGMRSLISAIIGAIASLAILVIGLQLSWSHIVCSPGVQSSGGPVGLFSGQSYECSNGRLTER